MKQLKKKNLVFLGAPGAGKGTIAKEMVSAYGVAHISTGDILRAEVAKGTPAGREAAVIMKAGKLVPDELVADMVRRRLAEPDCGRGFILDGFPRTIRQAELLEAALKAQGTALDRVICLDVPEDVLLQRLTARMNCPKCDAIYNKLFMPPKVAGRCDKCGAELVQRADDSLETAKKRLAVFREQTEPLIGFYRERGLLFTLSSGELPEKLAQIAAELE